jgi:hypothetical protein
MPCDFGGPCKSACVFSFLHAWLRVHRASGIPCALYFSKAREILGKPRARGVARTFLLFESCINTHSLSSRPPSRDEELMNINFCTPSSQGYGLDSLTQRMRCLHPVVPARANQGNAVRLFVRQCRGCPRNCKRRADDHLIPLGSVDPGKVVEGNDPRARKPAASHGLHARVGRGVPKRWKVRVHLPHWGEGRLSRPTCRRFGVRRWDYHRVKF